MNNAPYLAPPNTGLEFLHIDESLLVVSKPAGLLSVPGLGVGKDDCLASRVQAIHANALIVHRLDMATSGLMVLARNAATHRALSIAFQKHAVEKRYIAVVDGMLSLAAGATGEINLPLIADWPNRPLQKVDHEIGKASLTRYRVLAHDAIGNTTRVELEPETGRTHQLRVHLLSLGHPILGDALYASGETHGEAGRLLLHASYLAFTHPVSGELMVFSSAAPF